LFYWESEQVNLTLEPLNSAQMPLELEENDTKVLVLGTDIDGLARGKILSRKKFDSSVSFGDLSLI
jgi:hypothetical protein